MTINPIFATPLYRAIPEDIQTLNADLRDLVLSLETDDNRKANSPQAMHSNVFESDFDFLSRPEPVVEEFKQLIYSHLAGFVKSVNQLSEAETSALKFNNHCWFHITRSGGYFQPHNHPNASWSLVYCVHPGDETVADEKAAGHIVFADPRPQASSYMDPANDNLRRDMTFSSTRFRPRAGEILIFPSYLLHWVEPYIGESPRITIAANFWFYK